MSQVRLFFDIHKDYAEKTGAQLEHLFELEGYPVAIVESDEARAIWTVSLYLDDSEYSEASRKVENLLGEQHLSCSLEREDLQDHDWVTETLKGLAPVRAGRFVVHGSHDEGCAKPHEFAIKIDAAEAFGTGHHGTTAGCLDMISKVMKQKRFYNALDLGAGTGVLAIGIAKAARIPVLASDIDPIAAKIAAQNAVLNGVGNYVYSITAAGFGNPAFQANGPFDLVVANILAGPLQALAPDIAHHTAPAGTVILSGLLPHQKARITASFRLQGLHIQHAHYRDGWMTLVFERP